MPYGSRSTPRPSQSAGTRSRPWSAPATTRPGWHGGLASARGRSPSGPRGRRCWRAARNPGPGATLRCSSTSEATHFRTCLSCSGCWRAPATRGAGAPHCGWPRPHRIFRTAPPRHPGCNTAATRAPCWPPQRPTPPAGASSHRQAPFQRLAPLRTAGAALGSSRWRWCPSALTCGVAAMKSVIVARTIDGGWTPIERYPEPAAQTGESPDRLGRPAPLHAG